MHTNTSNNISIATEQMSLDTDLIEGAEIFHPDTVEQHLFHLKNVRNCNDSTNPLQSVAIDTEFDINHNDKGDKGERQSILHLIGICYTPPTGQVTMFLVNPKEVDEMNESDKN